MTAPIDIFVGRPRELETLRDALDHSIAGRGRIVMLAGEPGIGKTRTAQELALHVEKAGATVLWGHCHEEAGAPPTGHGCRSSAAHCAPPTRVHC